MLLKFPCIPATLKSQTAQATGIVTRLALHRELLGRGARLWRSKSWHFTWSRQPTWYEGSGVRRITPLEHFTGALSSVEQRIMSGLDCMLVR